jgi:hypothetical protein
MYVKGKNCNNCDEHIRYQLPGFVHSGVTRFSVCHDCVSGQIISSFMAP